MLHHVSFAADRPQEVAHVLAGLIDGRVSRFGPWPGGFIAWTPDAAGTAIEVYPTGTEMAPDPQGGQAQFAHNYFAQRNTATHAALSVDRTTDEILATAAAAGWRAHPAERGGLEVVEVWVEDRVMLEVMTPAMTARYLSVVDAPRIAASGTDYQSLTLSVRVATDIHTAWAAWTSAARLRRWWNVPQARIDLRVGGAFELLFQPDQAAGARGSEGCRVLSYVPDRMLSFSWNTPSHLSVGRSLTWVVLSFTEEADGTEVELVHNGFLQGQEWDEAREYFRHAWRRVLRRMADHWADDSALTAVSDAVQVSR